jgi:hypothetical protein
VEVEGDHPNDPGEDDAVKAQPRGGLSRDRVIGEDVIVEGVAAEGEEDQVPPLSVRWWLRLEYHRYEKGDVLHAPGLVVELGHEGSAGSCQRTAVAGARWPIELEEAAMSWLV